MFLTVDLEGLQTDIVSSVHCLSRALGCRQPHRSCCDITVKVVNTDTSCNNSFDVTHVTFNLLLPHHCLLVTTAHLAYIRSHVTHDSKEKKGRCYDTVQCTHIYKFVHSCHDCRQHETCSHGLMITPASKTRQGIITIHLNHVCESKSQLHSASSKYRYW